MRPRSRSFIIASRAATQVGRGIFALLVAFTWLTWSAHGNAEGRRLLVVLGPEEPTYWPWLRAELGSSGFAVKPSQAATFPPTPTAIEELALREGVAIGVAPLEAGSGIEIWLVDPISHRLAYREVLLGLYQPGEAPDVVAVRMAETLRATLIELGQRRGTVELPKPAPRLAAPQPPPARFMLGVGAGAAFSPGGVGSIGYVDVALGWRIAPRFSLLVDGALTPFATRLRGAEGTARVDWHWAGAALSFCVTDPAASLRLRSGAGVWLTVLTLTWILGCAGR